MNFQNELELLRCAIRYKNPKLAKIACDSIRDCVGNDPTHVLVYACTFVELSTTQENMRTLSMFLTQYEDEDDDDDAKEVPQVPIPDACNNVHSCDSEGSVDLYSLPSQQ